MVTRRAGVLLHPTSLPGPWGVGDLGPSAEELLDWLEEAGQSLWQVLPLGPPGSYGSPYSGRSAFGGAPLLISPDLLLGDGLLAGHDLALPHGEGDAGSVDYRLAAATKEKVLRRAFETFLRERPEEVRRDYRDFCGAPEQAVWLEDWALFETLRGIHRGAPWWLWPEAQAARRAEALDLLRGTHRQELDYHRFVQFLFDRQIRRLRSRAARRGILLVGDVPIYPARDSADVWSQRRFFQIDEAGRPLAVAGVPPDAFSETGQLWGNPLYCWQALRDEGYGWWKDRIAAKLRWFDVLRLDHFRGLEAYWRVPGDAETAEDGSWEPGPGSDLLEAMESHLGGLPLIAENLGVITPPVEELRRRFRLPGMAVLQFAFSEGGVSREHSPHGMTRDTVVYTGTHDNPPILEWWETLPPATRRHVEAYCGASGGELPRAMIRLAYTSVADLAVIPVQDLLGLGAEARMNTPGVAGGNWRWRLRRGSLTPELATSLAELAEVSGRTSTGSAKTC